MLYLTLGQENGKEKRKAPFMLQKVMKARGAWWHKADCSGTRLLTMPEELTSRQDKRDTHRLPGQLLECLVSYLYPWKRSWEKAFDNLILGLKLSLSTWPHHSIPRFAPHFILKILFFPLTSSTFSPPPHTHTFALLNQSVDGCRYKSGLLTNWKPSRDISAMRTWKAICHEMLS